MLNYIDDDGYTQSAYIAEKPRVHGELRFKFRPLTGRARVRAQQDVKSRDAEEGEDKAIEYAAKRIVSWSLKDRSGKPVPVTPAAIGNLQADLYQRVMYIAYHGIDGGDVDPDAKKGSPEDDAAVSGYKAQGLSHADSVVLKNDGT